MRRSLRLMLAALIAVSITAGIAVGGKGKSNEKNFQYAIALWGTCRTRRPRRTSACRPDRRHQRLADVEFSVHNGDLKAGNGSEPAERQLRRRAVRASARLVRLARAPAMFTPGDNDWTDCDRPANGGFNSLERLDHERQVFFSTTYSLGAPSDASRKSRRRRVPGHRRPDAVRREPPLGACKGVTYATLNVPGSCNNLCDTLPERAEYVGAQRGRHRLAAGDIRARRREGGERRDHDHRPGQSGLRRQRRHPRTFAGPEDARADRRIDPDGFHDFLSACATR